MNSETTPQNSRLMDLLINELKEIYCAEKSTLSAMPPVIDKCASRELKILLQKHVEQTRDQLSNIEKAFELMTVDARTKTCEAMVGLINEVNSAIEESRAGAMRDAAIISGCQKIKHYEIACYGVLRTFAITLGLTEPASIFHTILIEEKEMDERLSALAQSNINSTAAEETY